MASATTLSKSHSNIYNTQHSFCYETTKEAFENLQLEYIKRKSRDIVQGTLQLWSREKVNAYIQVILQCQNKDEPNVNLIPEEISIYDIIFDEMSDINKLVVKPKKNSGHHREVVPWEDCFDVILQIHRRLGHRGNCIKLYKQVLKKYVIDKIWVRFLVNACNMCQSDAAKKNTLLVAREPVLYFKCYQVFSQIMAKPDRPFTFILLVIDKLTNFVHLRPMPKFEVEPVTVELLKIFTDFGMPKMIATREVSFYEKVCENISCYTKHMKIPVLTLTMTEFPPWIELVKRHLDEWMAVNGSINWYFGCQIVQWQLNNTVFNDRCTPFKDIFHMEPVREIIN